VLVTMVRPVFFGWRVVAAAFSVASFTFGIDYYGPPVFLNALHQERGWPISVISVAITLHFLVSAVFVTRLPDAHRRFGVASVDQGGRGCTGDRHGVLVIGWRTVAIVHRRDPERIRMGRDQRCCDHCDGLTLV
jgi:hypothetical protein